LGGYVGRESRQADEKDDSDWKHPARGRCNELTAAEEAARGF
jgi:hypothetical protein